MPKINQNKAGGQIIFDYEDWMAGINEKGQNTIIGGGNYSSESIDPFSFLGVLSPGKNPTSVSNSSVVSGYLRSAVVHNSIAYLTSNDGKIIEMSDLTTGALTATAKQTITAHSGHSGVTAYDIVTY